MKIRNIALIAAAAIGVSGCATPTFFANAPFDASSTVQSISAKKIDAKNTTFTVYKINGEIYALIPSFNRSAGDFEEISSSLMLTQKQTDELKAACKEIIKIHGMKKDGETRIVDYHLTLNETEVVGASNSFVSNGVYGATISTQSQVKEVQRVIFRIQFIQSGDVALGEGKRIDYRFGGLSGKMSVEDVSALIEDLSK